jgi:hypothetical protein
MSLKAIKEALAVVAAIKARGGPMAEIHANGSAEIAALEKAAKDLTRLHLSDGADDVAHRAHVIAAMTGDPASQWNHPDVVAWGEAAQLLATIAKEAIPEHDGCSNCEGVQPETCMLAKEAP